MSNPQDSVTQFDRNCHENDAKSTKNRLIHALLDLWADAPADTVSVRRVVQKAGSAQAAIHYHFGDMEHLYLEASLAALAAAQGWMTTQVSQLDPLVEQPLPPALQASLIASIIAQWTRGQRRLAMAWRHAPDRDWQAAWDGFWCDVAQRIGLAPHADTLACFAAGEASRHLLVWNPPLDRALLEETTAALIGWLHDRRIAPAPVRSAFRALALQGYDEPAPRSDALADPITDAAATLLAEAGHPGVTFRAVAARAGVTLGKVIHVHGTKSALLHAALHRLYEREAVGDAAQQRLTLQFPPEVMLAYLLEAVLGGRQPVLAAYDEIERAIYNGEDYQPLRGLIRSMDDPTGTWALQQMLGRLPPSASLVAAFSAIIRGIGYRASHLGLDERDIRPGAEAALRPFLC